MNRERKKKMFDAVTDIRDDLIEQAQERKLEAARPGWRAWGLAAACLMLIAGLAVGLWRSLPFGGSAIGPSYYAGPVFPLTLDEPQESVTAQRHLTFDLTRTPEDIRLSFQGAHILDSYILSNQSEQLQQVTALYPFVGSFDELDILTPAASVDGTPVQTTLHFGSSGTCTGAQGTDNSAPGFNLLHSDSWEDFKTLLEDGTYQKNAFAPAPRLDQRVTIYEFTEPEAPLEEYPAATQAISFAIDPDRTEILLFGFNGAEFGDDGFRRYSYFVPLDGSLLPEARMLIVLGKDIGEYELQGYKNGACEKGNELEGVHADITRYEAVLSDIVDRLVAEFFMCYREGAGLPAGVSQEMYCSAVSQLLYQYGAFSGTTDSHYMDWSLDGIIADTNVQTRLFYLEFPLVIPPGGSTTVAADLRKKPGHDFPCNGSKSLGEKRYDLVTHLGSNLQFDQLTAEIAAHENMEILEQNFGFDLPGGTSIVMLDPEGEHYYLELRPAGAGP